MEQYIPKSALVAEINKRIMDAPIDCYGHQRVWAYNDVKDIINTIEVKDIYEQCIQYPSVKDGIKAHAEDYSFNIESELFPQLTKEQQKLWRREIEEACISGGDAGYSLAKDLRYKENLEVREIDLGKEIDLVEDKYHGFESLSRADVIKIIKHFFELALKVVQKEEKI